VNRETLADISIQDIQEHRIRKQIGKLMIALMDRFHCLPQSLFVSGVRLQSRDAVNAGGFADIFKGVYQSKQVALKRFRSYGNGRMATNKVRIRVAHGCIVLILLCSTCTVRSSYGSPWTTPIYFLSLGLTKLFCSADMYSFSVDDEWQIV
jgi:hypothetical protein